MPLDDIAGRWTPLRWAIAACVVALVLRIGYVLTLEREVVWPDARVYVTVARHIAAGDGPVQEKGTREASKAPGYPAFLALMRPGATIDDESSFVLRVRLCQALIGALMCYLVFALTQRYFGEAAGAIAAWLAALYPFFIYYTRLLLSETLFMAALTAALVLLSRALPLRDESLLKRTSSLNGLAGGLMLGVATLLRASALLMVPFFIVILVAVSFSKRGRKRARNVGLACACMVAGFVLVLTPWIARNYAKYNAVVPATLQSGESLYEACSPYADGGPGWHRVKWQEELGDRVLDEYQNDRFWRDKAVDWIRTHPQSFIRLALVKLWRFWNPLPNNPEFRRPFYAAVSLFSYVPVLLMAVAGAWMMRRRYQTLVPLYAPVAYYTLLHMVFVSSIRYRTPVMAFLMAFAAVTVKDLWKKFRRMRDAAPAGERAAPRRGRRIVWTVVAVALVACVYVVARIVWLPGAIQARVQERVKKVLGLDMQVSRVTLNGLTTVRMDKVTFTSSENGERMVWLTAPSVEIAPSATYLLLGNVRIGGITIEEPEVVLDLSRSGFSSEGASARMWADVCKAFPARIRVLKARAVVRQNAPTRDFVLSPINLLLQRERGGVVAVADAQTKLIGDWRLNARLNSSDSTLKGNVDGNGIALNGSLLPLLPPFMESVLAEARPSKGSAGARVDFTFDPSEENPFTWRASCSVEEATLSPRSLPFTVTNLSLTSEILADRMSGTVNADVGAGSVKGGGEVRMEGGSRQYDVTLRLTGIPLSQQLGNALPEDASAIWRRLSPRGSVDGQMHVEGPVNGSEPPSVRATLRLTNGSIQTRDMTKPIEGIAGTIKLDNDRLMLFDMQGAYAKAPVSVSYALIPFDPSKPFDFTARARGVALSSELKPLLPAEWLASFPYDVAGKAKSLSIGGRADITWRVGRAAGKQDIAHRVNCLLSNATASHPSLADELTEMEGTLTIANDHISAKLVRAKAGEARLSVSSALIERGGRLALRGAVNDLQVTPKSKQALPGALVALRDRAGLDGPCDIRFDVTSRDPKAPAFRYILAPHKARIKHASFPLVSEDVGGRVAVDERGIAKAELSGRASSGSFTLRTQRGDGGEGALSLTAKGVSLSEQIRDALPANLRKQWVCVSPGGQLDFEVTAPYCRSGEEAVVANPAGRVVLKDVSLTTSVPWRSLLGRVDIDGASLSFAEGKATPAAFDGGIFLQRADMGRFHLSDVTARASLPADAKTLQVTLDAASVGGGALRGVLALPVAQLTKPVNTRLKASNVVVVPSEGADAVTVTSSVSVHTLSPGLGGCVGKGKLTLQGKALGGLPGLPEVRAFFKLAKQPAPTFAKAVYTYDLRNGRALLHLIEFQSNVVVLRGSVSKDATVSDGSVRIAFGASLTEAGKASATVKEVAALLQGRDVTIALKSELESLPWSLAPDLTVLRAVTAGAPPAKKE